MAELILHPDNTPRAQQAMALHFEIKSSLAAAAGAMVDFCRQLKNMRDAKLYIHIGFDTFEDYVEKAHGIGQRQAYNYIQTYEKLGARLMGENAEAGITKLQLLTKISAVRRDEFLEENHLADISVAELEKLIAEKNGLARQVSLFRQSEQEKKDIQRQRDELAEKVKQLETRPKVVDTASVKKEIIDKAVQEAVSKAEKEKRKEIKEAIAAENSRMQRLAAKDKAAAVRRARRQMKEQMASENARENETIRTRLAQAQAKADSLEKQLKYSSNARSVKFKILFSSVQETIAELEDLIEDIRQTDPDIASKYTAALKRLFSSRCRQTE